MVKAVLLLVILMSLYNVGYGQHFQHLKTQNTLETPVGHKITIYRNGEDYCLTWKQKGSFQNLCGGFASMEKGHGRYPRFIEENGDYILLRSGCGSPCWMGDFLPLFSSGKGAVIDMYIAYDLSRGLVASMVPDSVVLHDLKLQSRRAYYTGQCESLLGLCTDSAYFNGDYLYYRWRPDESGSQKAELRKILVKEERIHHGLSWKGIDSAKAQSVRTRKSWSRIKPFQGECRLETGWFG